MPVIELPWVPGTEQGSRAVEVGQSACCGEAAVDGEDVSGDEPGVIGGEECHGPGDVIGGSMPRDGLPFGGASGPGSVGLPICELVG